MDFQQYNLQFKSLITLFEEYPKKFLRLSHGNHQVKYDLVSQQFLILFQYDVVYIEPGVKVLKCQILMKDLRSFWVKNTTVKCELEPHLFYVRSCDSFRNTQKTQSN